MIGLMWRFFASLLDWRLFLRKFGDIPAYEVAFITNIRDEIDKKRFLGKVVPKLGHFTGPKYYFRGVSGRTRAICSMTEDVIHTHTAQRAKAQCISAIEFVQERGAKVVLLAASTKRLFGLHGEEVKEMFPGLLFTIGDNGTFYLLLSETLRAFSKSGLQSDSSRICVIGPYGFLGTLMVEHLVAKGYKVVGLGSSLSRLRKMQEKYGIEIADSFETLGTVDAVVACTHSSAVRLTQETIDLIKDPRKKLLVVDVSEPSNLTEEEYNKPKKVVYNDDGKIIKTYDKVKNLVIRQDAGNGYSPKLRYVLGFITYKMFRLTQGMTFGCFMETLAWRKAMKDNPENMELRTLDLFSVNDENMNIISGLFDRYDIRIPTPKCFGKKVKSFDLDLHSLGVVSGDLGTHSEDDETKMF